MRQKIIFPAFLTISLFFMASCAWPGSDNNCRKHLSSEEMVEFLTDMFLLEAHLGLLPSQASGRDSIHYYYAGLFQKYNISPEEFEKTFECYLLDRTLMNRVFDETLNNLSIERSRVDEKKEEAQIEQLPLSPE